MNVAPPISVIPSELTKPITHIVIEKTSITLLPKGLCLKYLHRYTKNATAHNSVISDNAIFPFAYPI